MSNLMSRARAMLARNLQTAAGVASITITRKVGASTLSMTLTNIAWVGNTLFRLQTGAGGSRMEWGDRDYQIPADKYDFGAGPAEPAEKDRVTETINGQVRKFDTLAPEGEPAWRWLDNGRTILLLHTKCTG